MRFEIEISYPDGTTGIVPLSDPIEIGRETTGLVIDDPAISRRHLVLRPVDAGVEVEDLGSANGTMIDGSPLRGIVLVTDTAVVLAGDTLFRIREVSPPGAATDPAGRETVAPVSARAQAAATPRPPQRAFTAIEGDLITVNSVPGTVGASVAASVHDTAKRARSALSGFGSEPWGAAVTINIVDPFPHPDDPTHLVTGGATIDAEANTIWLVVTPESPPESPHRALALLFGAALPCAGDLDHLIEGYGIHLSGASEPEPETVVALPAALEDLDPAMRGSLVASFVRYLIAREGDEVFRRLLTTPSGHVSETWKELYGRSAQVLEASWRDDHENAPPSVSTTDFLRMSWRYLRPYRLRQAEVFGYMLLSLAFTVTYPFVTKRLFDRAIPSGEMSEVFTLLGALAAAFAVSLVAGLRQTYQGASISTSVVRDLREELFGRLQTVPDSWVSRHSQGDVLSRLMNDVGRVEAGLSTAIEGGVFQVVSLVVATVIMLQVNPLLGLIVLVGAPIVGFVYRRMSAGAMTRSMAVQEEGSAVMTVAAENYQANAVVKVFGLKSYEQARFRRTSDRLVRAQMRMSLFGGLFGIAVESIMTLLRLTVIGIGAWLIFEGRFTLGGLVAFLGIMGEVLSPVVGLTTLGQSIQSSVGAIIRIDEVLDAEPEPGGEDLPALGPLTREIRLEGVSLSYTPERRALDRVDVTIPAGSRVAFVGPSGSGKSTILRVLMRLYEPDEGRITIDGVDVRERSLASLRSQMGVVFQDSFLFDATVRENISLGSVGCTEAEMLSAARMAEVESFVGNLARGYDTLVGEGGRNLSGGQRQRVAIARALLGNPSIMLLDEATSALDPGTERQITETLERAGAGKTVIAITHRLTSVVDYDRIVVVDAGRIVEQGRHTELVERGGLYARLWAEQTGETVVEPVPFDLEAVLSRLPLFVDVPAGELPELVARFTRTVVESGSIVSEGGQLVVIERGRGDVEPTDEQGTVIPRSIGAGEVFGLNAMLGDPTHALLRMHEPAILWTLTEADLADLRRDHAEIDDAAAGRSTMAPRPVGRMLARATIGPGATPGPRSTVGVTQQAITAADVAAGVAAARAARR